MTDTRERVEVRPAPTAERPPDRRMLWWLGLVAVVALVAVGVWLVAGGPEAEMTVEEFAAAEDAIVVAVPSPRGITVQEFAAAEDMVGIKVPTLVGISPAEFAALEGAVTVVIPAPRGITVEEFAALEDAVGR